MVLIGPESKYSGWTVICFLFKLPNLTLLLNVSYSWSGSAEQEVTLNYPSQNTHTGSFPISNLMYMSLDRIGSVTLKLNVDINLQDLIRTLMFPRKWKQRKRSRWNLQLQTQPETGCLRVAGPAPAAAVGIFWPNKWGITQLSWLSPSDF